MTTTGQRIALAEASGFKWCWCRTDFPISYVALINPSRLVWHREATPVEVQDSILNHQPWCLSFVPHYDEDLKAIHEPSLRLLDTLGKKLKFAFHLSRIVQGLHVDPTGYAPGYKRDDGVTHWCDCVNATAAQRLEALLRTLELWDDTK